MDWQQLQAFHSLVQLGSMTRAAEAQFRTQSALSQQISRLEAALGYTLLNRIGKKGFTLTPAGEEFYLFAEKVLNQKKELLARLKELQTENIGRIRISSTHVGLWMLADVLKSYRTRYPKVCLSFLEKSPQDSVELLRNGLVDFSIVHGSSVPANVKSFTWMKGHYMLIVPKHHPLSNKQHVTLEDISRYELNLSMPNAKFSGRDIFDKKFQERGLTYTISLETSNIFLSIQYTSLGLGISFMLCYEGAMPLYDTGKVDFINMEHIFPSETISIMMRSNVILPEFKKGFLKMLLNKPDLDI